MELWYRSLSSYPLKAIKWAFEDYIANGADEQDRFWFPAPAQIGIRCREWCGREEGKSQISAFDQVEQWRRDKAAHPEKYASDDELEQLGRDLKSIAGNNQEPISDAEWERRQQQVREFAKKYGSQNDSERKTS